MFQGSRHLVDQHTITEFQKMKGFHRWMGDTSATDAEGISVVTPITYITQAGSAETRTLANGKEGQLKYLLNTVYAADTVVTPANLANGTTITFNAAGDGWLGIFHNGEWWTLALYGTAAVA